jgi:hypothetical protein
MSVRRSRCGSAVLLAALLLTAGCLGGGPGGTDGPPSPAGTPTGAASPAGSPVSPSPSPTPYGTAGASNQPDPDKAVQLRNDWNRSVDLRVRVVRDATNETVHDATYGLAPGEERTVYSLAEADPDGVESFTVAVTARNATERVRIETSRCYGDAYAEIRAGGDLYVFYAIC